jgi:4-amino-4-deoxy-L-arabinose transferase-like glycosyltransferase
MDESSPNRIGWLPMMALVIATCSLFLLRLDTALLEPEEARYSEIPRQMLAANEWIVPHYRGRPYYDKPPLLYWLVMLGYSAFGVHDWAARLVPGVCSALTVLVVLVWGRRIFGPRTAVWSALVLALTARFIYLGRMVATDAPLSLCVVAALACAHVALIGPSLRWRWWLASGLACGFGLLAKGPVVFVLVGAPALTYVLLNCKSARPGIAAWLAYLGAALACAAPWYIAVMARDPNFAEYFFWKHHVVRYVAPFDHAKPFWFYLPGLLWGTLPWSLLLIPCTHRLWSGRAEFHKRRPPEVVFPLVAAIWCILFFSISGSKRVGYVLPVFAPLALVVGEQIERMLARGEVAWPRLLPAVALLMTGIGAAALAAFEYVPIGFGLVALILLLAAAVGAFVKCGSMAPHSSFAAAATIVFVACLTGIESILPAYAERFSLRREVMNVRAAATDSQSIVCFPRGWDSVCFYLQRSDVLVYSEAQRDEAVAYLRMHPDSVLFVREGEATRRLLKELTPLVFVECDRQGNVMAGRVQLAPREHWAYNSGTD